MTEKITSPNKAELLAKIRETRGDLEALLMRLTEAQLTTPNVQEQWSIKDMLAHIAAWERFTVARLHSALTGEPLKVPPVSTDEQVDAMNARVYAENKNRPLNEVRAEFEAAHQEIYDLVASLDEGFLLGPLPFDWAKGKPVWAMVVGNTIGHYPEHSEAIQAWLGKK